MTQLYRIRLIGSPSRGVIPEMPKALSGIVTNSGQRILRSRINAKAFSGMTVAKQSTGFGIISERGLMSFLLDTNAVSEWTKPKPDPALSALAAGVTRGPRSSHIRDRRPRAASGRKGALRAPGYFPLLQRIAASATRWPKSSAVLRSDETGAVSGPSSMFDCVIRPR